MQTWNLNQDQVEIVAFESLAILCLWPMCLRISNARKEEKKAWWDEQDPTCWPWKIWECNSLGYSQFRCCWSPQPEQWDHIARSQASQAEACGLRSDSHQEERRGPPQSVHWRSARWPRMAAQRRDKEVGKMHMCCTACAVNLIASAVQDDLVVEWLHGNVGDALAPRAVQIM